MKNQIFMAMLIASGTIFAASAQQSLVIKMKDNTIHKFPIEEISQMTLRYSEVFLTCPDNHHPHIIDLGLPSGTKWACCNVGAPSPDKYGGYFAWGETEEKDYYDWSTYIHCDGSNSTCHYIGDNIAGTKNDVAHVKWGDSWRMPTRDQMQELIDYCSSEWKTLHGASGIMFSSPNGNSIFLPAAGYRWKENCNYEMVEGNYWTSLLDNNQSNSADVIGLASSYLSFGIGARCSGFSVRAIIPKNPTEEPKYPVAQAIDLGLSSGTKWASWNIGASAPEEIGVFFAWGETDVKDCYNWSTYYYCYGTQFTCFNIGEDIAGTEYDVAHVKWGGSWQMPSLAQMKELLNTCTMDWTTRNGVNGALLTGPNGKTIFLPAGGYRSGDMGDYENEEGIYWSSTFSSNYDFYASFMYVGPGYKGWSDHYRLFGNTVRAVCR